MVLTSIPRVWLLPNIIISECKCASNYKPEASGVGILHSEIRSEVQGKHDIHVLGAQSQYYLV